MKSNFTIIIPARFASSRFPGKPLALINGVPMILRVWEKACKICDEVYIATDDNKIHSVCEKAGARVLMTSSGHLNGTERVAEAATKIFQNRNSANEIIINIQGDEPLITTEAIISLFEAFRDKEVSIATLVHKITDQGSTNNPNRPKVVFDRNHKALYFSRAAIPFSTDSNTTEEIDSFQHIGVYGFKFSTLQKLVKLSPSPLEQREKLEQLRWMEHGYTIHCVESDYQGIGVDVPEDLDKLMEIWDRG